MALRRNQLVENEVSFLLGHKPLDGVLSHMRDVRSDRGIFRLELLGEISLSVRIRFLNSGSDWILDTAGKAGKHVLRNYFRLITL